MIEKKVVLAGDADTRGEFLAPRQQASLEGNGLEKNYGR